MKRVGLALTALMIAAALLPAARADAPGTVWIGGILCFKIRTDSKEGVVQQRVDKIHDVFAKHLGGAYQKFTAKRIGSRYHIYLNGEFIIAVWPADAKATGYKSSTSLGKHWAKRLQAGFKAAHAGPG